MVMDVVVLELYQHRQGKDYSSRKVRLATLVVRFSSLISTSLDSSYQSEIAAQHWLLSSSAPSSQRSTTITANAAAGLVSSPSLPPSPSPPPSSSSNSSTPSRKSSKGSNPTDRIRFGVNQSTQFGNRISRHYISIRI